MIITNINIYSNLHYISPERRFANTSRRSSIIRRHRIRTESLVSDCRIKNFRRLEDEDGYIEISTLYADNRY